MNELKDYMLNNKMITNNLVDLPNDIIRAKIVIQPKVVIQSKVFQKTIFYPKEKDSLFWCFYLLKFGHEKYEILFNKNEIIEKQIKVEYVEKLRNEKALVKTYKFDTLTNIESNLVNDKYLNLPSFLTLCAIENINVLYLNKTKKTYFEFVIDETKDKYIIYSYDEKYEKKYGFELNKDNKDIKIKENNYKIENIKKPIKSITSYTIKELNDIAQKLGIDLLNKDTNKNKLKKDLYEDITKRFL